MKKWNIDQALEKMEPLHQVSEESKNLLKREAQLVVFHRGDNIWMDQDIVEAAFIVVEGQVAIYKVTRQGNKKIIFVYKENAFLNEVILQEPKPSADCEAMSTTTLLKVPRHILLQLMASDPVFNQIVIDSMAMKIRQLYHQVKNAAANQSVGYRLMSKLYKLALDFGETHEDGSVDIMLKLNGTILAEMVGASRESISRYMSLLKEQGYIGRRNGHLYIKGFKDFETYLLNHE